MNDSAQDPVCGMQVSLDSYAMEHLGMHYAFCSRQCQDRFKANPHLYVGVPGQMAPKHQGMEVVKQRRFRLEQPMPDTDAAILVEALGSMMGIKHIEVAGDIVSITYDLLQATAEQIEACIMGQVGLRLGTEWSVWLQRGFVHYLEEVEVGNLEVKPHSGHH
ncbi:MAG: YHS domain-containing protein [Thiobacillus sp.]